MRGILVLVLGLIVSLSACKKDSADPIDTCATPEEVSFSTDIQPIMDTSCAYSGCHTVSFSSGDFTSYEELAEKAESGSLLARVVNNKDMPPSYAPDDKPQELSSCDIELVLSWINAGYPNN